MPLYIVGIRKHDRHFIFDLPICVIFSNSILSILVPLDAVEIKFLSFNQQVVYSDGTVVPFSSLITIAVSCPSDVSQFPYDKQHCPVIMGSWILGHSAYFIGKTFKISKISEETQIMGRELFFQKNPKTA